MAAGHLQSSLVPDRPGTFGLGAHLSSHSKPVLNFILTTGGWVGSLRDLNTALLADTAQGCVRI